jgi:hypothetical protein
MDEVQPHDASSEPQVLGGNIELTGFRPLDGGSMIVLKKIIGNYARKFSDNYGSEKLALQLMPGAGMYALRGTVHKQGKIVTSDHADANVFFVVDTVLKKLENQLTSP